jgi:hypothetical protein
MAQTRVDQNAIRFTQVTITAVIVLAGALTAPWLIAALAALMTVGASVPQRSPFHLLYRRVAVPLRIVHPRLIPDDPAPHRFAHGLGAGVLWLASLALFTGASLAGWALAGLVAALAMLNVLGGFCAGCFVYYQLARRGWLPRRAQGQ